MLRFIIRKRFKDSASGYEGEGLFTVDVKLEKIEELLTMGGFGEDGYERCELVGVEVVDLVEDKQ
jgi:hypothetical protein